MKSKYLLAGALLGASLLCAQPVAIVSASPVPAPYTVLKQYLGLSDTQLQALQDIQKSRAAADQAIYKQISDKQMTLNNLLAAGSNDALQIGQLTLDINSLRKQLPGSGAPYRESALAALTQDQRNKLTGLTNALQLQSAAYQAIGLNLIDALSSPKVLPLAPAATEPQEGLAR